MIIKAQSQKLPREAAVAAHPRLTAVERGMLTWAMLEPGDKVLDMNSGSGLLLEYLARHMECEICGIADNMENVRQARSRLKDADILYASQEDIPWRDDSFDAVFLRRLGQDEGDWDAILKEILRVLKPGGQFLLGVASCPEPLRGLANLLVKEEPERPVFRSKGKWMHTIGQGGYAHVSWQQIKLGSGLAIGWKPLDERLRA